ncbi:MAG TPA: cadherin-like domain-containing protein, partial [Gemmatimonadales bacterium]
VSSSITVTPPPNQPPTASADQYEVASGTALTVGAPGVLGNDNDPDGDTLTASAVDQPANGTLALSSDGSFTYTPNTGFSGQDTFTYTAGDGTDTSAPATVTITVDPPVVGVSPGPPSEAAQDFTVAPTVSPSGTLTYTPATRGKAKARVAAHDDGARPMAGTTPAPNTPSPSISSSTLATL